MPATSAVLHELPVLQVLPDPALAVDADGRVLSANSAAERFLSRPRAEVIGSLFLELLPAEQPAALEEALKRANDATLRTDIVLQFRDGRRTVVELTAAPVQSAGVRVRAVMLRDVTAEREREATLRESERNFRTLGNSIPQLAWMADSTGWIFWYNERWYEYTGTTFEEMKGWGWRKVHHPEHVDRVVERIRHSFETGEPWEDTFPLRSRTGEYRWFLSRAMPVRDAEGHVVRWFGTNTDITEQLESSDERERLLEEIDRERTERTSLLQSTDQGIFGIDLEGRMTWVNRAAAEILGYTPDEMIGRNGHDLVHHSRPDGSHYAEEDCPIYRAMHAGKGVRVDSEVLWRKHGTAFPAEYSSYPIVENGEVAGAVVTFSDITERVRAERALRESEERFRALAENATVGIFVIDERSAIEFANPAVERIFGYKVEEILGRSIDMLMPADQRPLHDAGIRRYLATGRRNIPWEGIELPGLTKAGRVVPLEISMGEFVREGKHYFTGIARDITTKKRGEDALRFLAEASTALASSIDYEATLRRVAQLVVPTLADFCLIDLVDEDGNWFRVASEHADPGMRALAREAVRYPPDPNLTEHPAMRAIRSGKPEITPEFDEAAMRASARSPEHLELMRKLPPRAMMVLPLIARDRTLGAIQFISMRAQSARTYDADDLALAEEIGRRAAVAIDNARLFEETETARAEAERRAREEAALRQAAEAVSARFTVEEVIRQIAASALDACGADGSAVERVDIDRNELEVVAVAGQLTLPLGSRLPYPGSLTQQVLEHREPQLISEMSEDARVPAHWRETCGRCSAMALPLVDGGGEIGALFLLRRSEKRIFRSDEVTRAHTFADLAALAFQKVHLLEETERSRVELVHVMESRSRLMRGFSHDVKNPLGAANGFLQLLEEGIIDHLTDKQKESVGRARRAIAAALRLIEDLLDLARAEAGELEIRLEPVDVRDVASAMVEEHRAAAEAKGLTMDVQLPDNLAVIQSDAARVRQIVANLLSNAVKYTPEGGITVRVLEREDVRARRAGRWISLAVSDTGPGIPQEKQHLLFQEFKRIEPGVARGAGLGLAISKRIAEALGGDISVKSEAGKGSTFTLWLPLARGE